MVYRGKIKDSDKAGNVKIRQGFLNLYIIEKVFFLGEERNR